MPADILSLADIQAIQITGALVFVALGHVAASKLSIKISARADRSDSLKGKTKRSIRQKSRYITYISDIILTISALIVVNASAASEIYMKLISLIPQFATALLLLTLGIVTINLSTVIARNFAEKAGAQSYLKQVGITSQSAKIGTWILKGFLYIGLLQIVLSSIGIGDTIFSPLIRAFSYALALLAVGLAFYGFKDLLGNLSSGLYLKNASAAKPGEQILLDDQKGRIKDISLFSTTVETDDGYTLLTPNSKMADSQLKFKRSKQDIRALEDLRTRFASKSEELSLEASAELSLAMFGIDKDQERINKKLKDLETEDSELDKIQRLPKCLQELTNKEVRSTFVDGRNVNGISRELKTWFSNGGTAIVKFSKKDLFPDSEKDSEYALAASVEENGEILLMELGAGSSNGVYYVQDQNLESSLKSEGNGYAVISPDETTASWRIDKDLTYSDISDYDDLSQNLELRLTRLLRKGRVAGSATSPKLSEFLKQQSSSEFHT